MAALAALPLQEAQAAFGQALLDGDVPAPSGLSAWNGSDPARRFAVYRNNVVISLTEALAVRYPTVKALVGEAFFAAMAGVYVRREPPRSPLLFTYGGGFADFIAAFPPAASVPYLADVARLEFARGEAYHAADATPAPPDAFSRLAAQDIGAVRFAFLPSLRLVRSAYPVLSILAAHDDTPERRDQRLADLDMAAGEIVLIARPDDRPDMHAVTPDAAAFIDALAAGLTLAEATISVVERSPNFDLTKALAAIIQSRIVMDVTIAGGSAAAGTAPA